MSRSCPSMTSVQRGIVIGALVAGFMPPADAQPVPLEGTRRIVLHARDGTRVDIGNVRFEPATGGTADLRRFTVAIDHAPFRDHFLSMREFKCLDGTGEILCHVPYPYSRPDTVTPTDLAWLEHALMFMFKKPADFGAKLWNGVYWQLRATSAGTLEGRPQAIDLNRISAPPARLDVPPYRPAQRDDIPEGARWFVRLTVE